MQRVLLRGRGRLREDCLARGGCWPRRFRVDRGQQTIATMSIV